MAKNYYWSGLSSETMPTGAQVPIGAEAKETDTGDTYEFDGTTWRQTGTGGAAHTNQQGGILDYGTWPALYYEPLSAALTASASGTTVFQSNFITGFNGLVVEVVAIGGTTPKLSLYPSIDGTNIAATALGWVNLQTGAVISGATGLTAIGIYAMLTPADAKTKYSAVRMVQTGGASDQTCTLRYAHVWA